MIEDSVRPYDEWPSLLRGLGFVDPELVTTLADNAGATLRWLTGFGVEFDFLPNYFITESTTRMAPAGGGLALVEALAAHAETVPDRIEIHYETTARRLALDAGGRVNGVEATGANNRTMRLSPRTRGRTGLRRLPGQSGDAEPLRWLAEPVHPPGGARRLLQPGRRHPHGA